MQATIPVDKRQWITVLVANPGGWDNDSSACWLSKPCAESYVTKPNFEKLMEPSNGQNCVENIIAVESSDWMNEIEHLIRGSNKERFQHGLDSDGNLLYVRAIQGDSGKPKVDPTLQGNVMLPMNFVEYIYHVGCSHDLPAIIQCGLDCRRKRYKKGRQTVFFTAVDPVQETQGEEPDYDVAQPRIVPYNSKRKVHQNAVYRVNLPGAQKKGLTFYQTQSSAIILHDPVPADCVARVVNMKSKRNSVRGCVFITSSGTKDCFEHSLEVRHEDHQHADGRKSDVEHGETRSRTDIWQNRRKEYQQAGEVNSLSSTGKPVAELKQKHIFGKLDVKTIKKQMKMKPTSSAGRPVPDKKRTSTQKWITEFKEYPAEQFKKETTLEDETESSKQGYNHRRFAAESVL